MMGWGVRPSCDWFDPAERDWLIDALVTDANSVLTAVAGLYLDCEQADAV